MPIMKLLIVAASGGLGSTLVREALSRGHQVSVLVRSRAKLAAALPGALERITVHEGDATAAAVSRAAAGVDAIISAAPPLPDLARTLAEQATAGASKLVWVAGSSNMLEADGVTPHHISFGPMGMQFFSAHAPAIAAIQGSAANHVIFCPGRMSPAASGQRSSPSPRVYTHAAPQGESPMDYVSYEDAAGAMLDAAEVSTWDRALIQVVSPKAAQTEL